MTTSIEALISSGDHHAALEALVDQHGAALGRFCAALTGSSADADELLQDTLVAALDAMPGYRGDANPRAWAFGIARRVCHSAIRRQSRRRGLFARFFAFTEADPAPSDRADARLALGPALARLEPRLREAVLLRYQQGMDALEVAAALGVSHAAARKRISRGVRALRATVADAPLASPSTTPEPHHEPQPLRAAGAVRVLRP